MADTRQDSPVSPRLVAALDRAWAAIRARHTASDLDIESDHGICNVPDLDRHPARQLSRNRPFTAQPWPSSYWSGWPAA